VSDQTPALKDRVLAELKRKPGMKATELAELLGVDRREVNRCLAHELAGQVQQGSDYRWRPVDAAPPAATAPIAATSEIGKLCRYYLECIGQDMDEGASAFASSKYGEPDYAELPRLPTAWVRLGRTGPSWSHGWVTRFACAGIAHHAGRGSSSSPSCYGALSWVTREMNCRASRTTRRCRMRSSCGRLRWVTGFNWPKRRPA
jgi:hypothetical protein